MTAAINDIATTDKLGTEELPPPPLLSFPVEANTQIFAGTMVATNAAGNAVPANSTTAKVVWGRCERGVNNLTTNAPNGAAGVQQVGVRPGAYYLNQDATISQANVGQNAYVVDDNTVSLNDNGGARIFAGVIQPQARFATKALTTADPVPVYLGVANGYSLNAQQTAGGTAPFRARNVITTALAAYTAAAGVITANANGAFATQDGVTAAVGDVVLLPAGIAATATDAGPYTIVSLGAAGAKFQLQRCDWMPTGAVIKTGTQIRIGGEGTTWKNTIWEIMAASDTVTVDTSDLKMFPTYFAGQTALVAGTFTIAGAFLSTKSTVTLMRAVANTASATIMYSPTSAGANGITAGNMGTGVCVVQACVAAGTINAADISTLSWEVTNQPA